MRFAGIYCFIVRFICRLFSNPPIVSQAPVTTQSSQTSQLPSLTTSTGKLDLANVMKLCGIMDDDDFMDADETPQPPPPPSSSTPYEMPTSLSTNTTPSDIMVTIPYVQNSDMSHNRVSIEDNLKTKDFQKMSRVKFWSLVTFHHS